MAVTSRNNDASATLKEIRERSQTLDKIQGPALHFLRFLGLLLAKALAYKVNQSIVIVIAMVMSPQGQMYTFKQKPNLDLYFIGGFRKKYHVLDTVSKALAPFYMEMQILPNVHLVSLGEITEDPLLVRHIIKMGVVLYDRERDLS